MFGLAAAAACMPSHEDWLNDLSLTPPKSLTMHPVKWALVVVGVDDELGLAHPAASRATAASAAPAWRAFLTCYLLFRSACDRRLRWGGLPLPRADRWSPHFHPGTSRACRSRMPCLGMIAG